MVPAAETSSVVARIQVYPDMDTPGYTPENEREKIFRELETADLILSVSYAH